MNSQPLNSHDSQQVVTARLHLETGQQPSEQLIRDALTTYVIYNLAGTLSDNTVTQGLRDALAPLLENISSQLPAGCIEVKDLVTTNSLGSNLPSGASTSGQLPDRIFPPQP